MRVQQSAVAAILSVLVLSSAHTAHASHFRYGHYTWKPGGGNTILFTLQNAFRRDGYPCISPATLITIPCTGPGGRAGVGDVIPEFIGASRFDPGDGSVPISSPLGVLLYVVTSIDPGNNNLFALALDPAALPSISTTIAHTYPAPGNYLAFTDSCCRISALVPPNAHINNPDGGYRVETLVNVGTSNSSPVSSLPPIVICPINSLCSFFVLANDPNGDRVRYRLSTSAEASSFVPFVQPGPPKAPHAATIDSATGLYTWDTTGAVLGPAGFSTLYSTQVTLEDLDAGGNVKSKTALDFMIQLVPLTPPLPVFDSPPTIACGSTLSTVSGVPVTFPIQASVSSSTKTITLNVVGLPLGATMTPQLPLTGNPVGSTFFWIPGPTQLGSNVVTFEARDSTGQQVLCSVAIQVLARVLDGRMTGGGAVALGSGDGTLTHGFELHCDGTAPNNLEVNWSGNQFHLDTLTSAMCFDDPLIKPNPPDAAFDTYHGVGSGRLNGVPGATAEWVFTDAGEPGRNDRMAITIRDGANEVVISVSGILLKGNHQSH